ncbi:hypothetical protein GJ496_000951 [Pomphorhynchus laevis]|nr:hypothetical protein GJ496_000951 [Pomphorhynchus laevis]
MMDYPTAAMHSGHNHGRLYNNIIQYTEMHCLFSFTISGSKNLQCLAFSLRRTTHVEDGSVAYISHWLNSYLAANLCRAYLKCMFSSSTNIANVCSSILCPMLSCNIN